MYMDDLAAGAEASECAKSEAGAIFIVGEDVLLQAKTQSTPQILMYMAT